MGRDHGCEAMPHKMLDEKKYYTDNACPENDRLCNEEAIWFTQNMLLGERSSMDDIAHAMDKIRKHAGKIKQKAGG